MKLKTQSRQDLRPQAKQQPRGKGATASRPAASSPDRSSGAPQPAKSKTSNAKAGTTAGSQPGSRKPSRSPMRNTKEASSRGASPVPRGVPANDDGGTGGSSGTGVSISVAKGGQRPNRRASQGSPANASADAAGTGTTLGMKSTTKSATSSPGMATATRSAMSSPVNTVAVRSATSSPSRGRKQVRSATTTPSPERTQTGHFDFSTTDVLEIMYPRSLSPEWGPQPCWPGAIHSHNRQGAGWSHRTSGQRQDTNGSKMPYYATTEPWNRTRNRSQSSVWSRERSSRSSPIQWGNRGNYVTESRMDGKHTTAPVRRLHREDGGRSAASSAPPSPSPAGRDSKGKKIEPVLKTDSAVAGGRAPKPLALTVQKTGPSVLEEWCSLKEELVGGVGNDAHGFRRIKDWERGTGPEFKTSGKRREGWTFSGEERGTSEWVYRGVDRQTELAEKSMTRVAARRNQSPHQGRRARSLEQDRFRGSSPAPRSASQQRSTANATGGARPRSPLRGGPGAAQTELSATGPPLGHNTQAEELQRYSQLPLASSTPDIPGESTELLSARWENTPDARLPAAVSAPASPVLEHGR